MSEYQTKGDAARRESRQHSIAKLRAQYDTRVFAVFLNPVLQRAVHSQPKTNLESLWEEIARKLRANGESRQPRRIYEPLQIHRQIIEGLPGEALFVSSAMAFDSMADALRLFDVSAKTAKQRLGERLSPSEGEIALRIGRALTIAQDAFGSLEGARRYLRTPNFALGGAVPRDLLKTTEGEQLVLTELQTQAQGGPV